MPVNIIRYDVLISRPGDAKQEAQVVRDSLLKLNHAHSKDVGIELIPVDWERDTRADSGDQPQKLINKQLVEGSDIVIAVFKQYYGTPTGDYGSGTEEEIMLGLEMGKRVMLYCWTPSGDSVNTVEIEKINDLKNRLGDRVLYKSYSDCDDLREKLDFELAMLLGALKAESAKIGLPALSLKGISRDGLVDGLVIRRPNIAAVAQLEKCDKGIRALLDEVERNPLPVSCARQTHDDKHGASSSSDELMKKFGISSEALVRASGFFATEPYDFPSDEQELIRNVMASLDINEPNGLFNLGNLRKQMTFDPLNASKSYAAVGTADEKARHKLLTDLGKLCRAYCESSIMVERFSELGLIGLAVANYGGKPAHHVRIELRFPIEIALDGENIPSPGDYLLEGYEHHFAEALLTIAATEYFESYDETVVRGESGSSVGYMPPFRPHNSFDLWGPPAFDESDYREQVDSLLGDYIIVKSSNGSELILKLSMDCVRHGAAYAFPVFIPVIANGLGSLRYCIYADESPNPIEGILEFAQQD